MKDNLPISMGVDEASHDQDSHHTPCHERETEHPEEQEDKGTYRRHSAPLPFWIGRRRPLRRPMSARISNGILTEPGVVLGKCRIKGSGRELPQIGPVFVFHKEEQGDCPTEPQDGEREREDWLKEVQHRYHRPFQQAGGIDWRPLALLNTYSRMSKRSRDNNQGECFHSPW